MSADRVPPRPDAPPPTLPAPPIDGAPERPKATWSWWEAIAVYLVAFLLGGVATIPFLRLIDDEDLASIASAAAAAVTIVGVLLVWLWTAHPSWRGAVGLPGRGRWPAEIRAGIGFGIVLYPVIVLGVGLVVSALLRAVSGDAVQAPEQVPSHLSAVGALVTGAYAIVIAPVHEELFFRGILFRGIRDRFGLTAGLIASGVGFALIHYTDTPWHDALLLMGVMLVNGIALAWFYERRGNLVANTVAHMVFNVIGLTLILTID